MWTFRSTHSLRAPFFFSCYTSGDAFVTPPGCTGSRIPCRTLSQASLWPCLVEVEVSFWLCRTLAVIPVWVSDALCILWLQVWIAQLLVVFAYTCVRSTQHHMLVIPEALVDDRHRPQEVWISQFNWGSPSSGQINDDIMVLSAPVSTCFFILWSFTVIYSHVTDMLNAFSRV